MHNSPMFFLLRTLSGLVSPVQRSQMAREPYLTKGTPAHFQVALVLLQLFMFQLHAMKRLWESLAVANFSSESKQHVIVTVLGL